jgi:S-adenosylmethionine synthetase
VQYVNGEPIGCTKVVVSTQHNPETRNGKKYTPAMVKELIEDAVSSALPDGWMPKRPSDFLVNPTGNFVVGGPDGDCGLTGRKISRYVAGYAPHGGGAFSGRIPPRSTARPPMRRAISPRTWWRPIAERCTIQIAAIGVADLMSVWSAPTAPARSKKLEKVLPQIFRLTRPTSATTSS